jgi:manganese/iron transport system permease protein
MSWLVYPFTFDFMQAALAISVLIAAAAGALSCFLVLKGWSLMGDAISHAVLPGIVFAYMLGIPLVIGAFAAGMLCATATGFLAANSRVKPDTVMGVVFSGMFGAGIVLYRSIETDVHLDHILFGHMLGVSWADVRDTGLIAGAALVAVLARRRDLLLFAFDPQHARAVGLPVGMLHYGLLALISMVVVGALEAVGLILAIALLIAPGAIAYLLTDRFERMLALSIATAVLAAVAGLLLSFYVDADPAASIVVVLTALFILAFLFAPKHGILAQRRQPGSGQPG